MKNKARKISIIAIPVLVTLQSFASSLVMEQKSEIRENRPNIVLIYIDDMGFSDISAYGAPNGQDLIETPNLDQLVSEGKKFTNAVVAAPPYYFPTNQVELIDYFKSLADESSLPLFLYNMPSHTKVHFEPETGLTLAEHSNIIGFKDSSGDLLYFQNVVRLLQNKPELSLLVGPEKMLMQTMLSGGHGGVNGGANMFPKLYVAMYEAALEKNFERMLLLQGKILQISSSLYTVGCSSVKYLQGLKCALSLMGICDDKLELPYNSFGDQEKEKIRKSLEQLNVEEVFK